MLDHVKPATAARAATRPSSKSTRTGYEPRPEAKEAGQYREIQAFLLLVGLCMLGYWLFA